MELELPAVVGCLKGVVAPEPGPLQEQGVPLTVNHLSGTCKSIDLIPNGQFSSAFEQPPSESQEVDTANLP